MVQASIFVLLVIYARFVFYSNVCMPQSAQQLYDEEKNVTFQSKCFNFRQGICKY